MTTPACVYANIATRDGRIHDEVLVAVQSAVLHAGRAGLRAGMARSCDHYSTAACRNRAVATFLAEPRHTHLLMVDDDVVIPADTITRLFDLSERRGAAVTLGCYPTVRKPLAGPAFLYVAVMPLGRSGDAGWPRSWPGGELECAAGGTGCMMIRREVFEALGFPWFRWGETYSPAEAVVRATTDDADFCARARAAGYSVWADGGVRCGHKKAVDLAMFVPPA